MPTPPGLDPLTMKRLAFIRILFQQGNDQSRRPEPLACTAVLSYHDAVEHFLALAAEHLGATLPNHIQFMKYWDELHPNRCQCGVELSTKTGMDRLNRLRNGFKHAGSMPGLAAVAQARGDVAAFFEDNTPKVFGVQFDAINMADLIPQEDVRELVKEAAAEEDRGDRAEAMALLREAFTALISSHVHQYVSNYSPYALHPPFSIGPDLAPSPRFRVVRGAGAQDGRGPSTDLGGYIERLAGVAGAAQMALRVMTLGLDYHAFVRFDHLAPHVHYAVNLDNRFVAKHPDYAPTSEHYRFCEQFVITAALRRAETESVAEPPPWLPRQNDRGPSLRSLYLAQKAGDE